MHDTTSNDCSVHSLQLAGPQWWDWSTVEMSVSPHPVWPANAGIETSRTFTKGMTPLSGPERCTTKPTFVVIQMRIPAVCGATPRVHIYHTSTVTFLCANEYSYVNFYQCDVCFHSTHRIFSLLCLVLSGISC